MNRDEITARLRCIPAFAGLPSEGISISRLGGLTNTNLKIETSEGAFALQIRTPDPEGYRNAAATIEALRMAERLGIGPDVVHADADVVLTRWIGNIEGHRVTSREAGTLLARLHRSGERLSRRFDPFDAIRRHLHAIETSPLSPDLTAAVTRAEADAPTTLVPIHGDPVPENFLEAGDRLLLIDWEYAGMGDPAWDLAYVALEAGMAADEETQLRASYRDPRITHERLARAKMVAASLAVLWGTLRMRRQPSPDLSAWIATRLRQAEALSSVLYPAPGSG